MAKPWYKKSKYNNPPMIVYKGSCDNCGRPFEAYEKNTEYTCCIFETVVCDVAIDLNKDKYDCHYLP